MVADKKFRIEIILLMLILSVSIILSIAGQVKYSFAAEEQEELSNLFWPAPPADPRIFFVKNISSYENMEIKKSFFGRMKDLLVGRKKYFPTRPMAMTIGADGVLYIADGGSGSVYIFNPGKKRIQRITRVDEQTSFVSPVGIGVSPGGLIFVADSYLNKVFAVDTEGVSRFILSKKEGILRPTGLFAGGNKLYVVDTQASRVSVFDFEGRLLFEFGRKGKGEGEFNLPTNIYVDGAGKIYVSDTLNFRIQIFDSRGNFLKAIGSAGDSSGYFSRPKGVAVDSYGHIYVADALFDNIQIFDYEKNFLLSFGEAGSGDGEFWLPAGIAIDKDNYIYVADSYNQRIAVFRYVGGE